ncbi:hypothetical protein [Natrinema halophilum]|uniref:Uncharacterized protein n=1 Tax=Natrinema halophilum TaxID=1699371 RepID=A0A7D5GM03_9EURY|nr:hypothetical protein [Natrinema halophilum]QLG48113.1 hypothetical protein HYG82_04250 [Natrinema halophilum]
MGISRRTLKRLQKSQDTPSEPSTPLSSAVEAGEKIEELQAQRIENLNSTANTIFASLVGGSSIFAGLAALLSFFGSGGGEMISASLLNYITDSPYFISGIVFFGSSVLFTLLAIAPYRYRRGVDQIDLTNARLNKVTSTDQWHREVLDTVIRNIEYNATSITWKVHVLFASVISLVISLFLFAIVVLELLSTLEQNGSYEIPSEVTHGYLVDEGIVTVLFLLIICISYFPVHVQFTPYSITERLVDGDSTDWCQGARKSVFHDPISHFSLLPFTVLIIESVGVYFIFREGMPPGWRLASAIIVGLVLSFLLHIGSHVIQYWIDREPLTVRLEGDSAQPYIELGNNYRDKLNVTGWSIEVAPLPAEQTSEYTFPPKSEVSESDKIKIYGERGESMNDELSIPELSLTERGSGWMEEKYELTVRDSNGHVKQKVVIPS